jgi:DTW domain-containing protein YfiP
MNVETYKEIQRSRREEEMRRGRVLCPVCLQPPFGCYCASLRRFDPKIEFVVLIHPLEARRRIATGRMSHLCMRGSRLIRGEDFSDNAQVNAIARDPNRQAVVLYPGPRSLDLSALDRGARASLFPASRSRFSSSTELGGRRAR